MYAEKVCLKGKNLMVVARRHHLHHLHGIAYYSRRFDVRCGMQHNF